MKYTYELSQKLKRLKNGDSSAFEDLYLMTVNDTYFHVKLVVGSQPDIDKVMTRIYKYAYIRIGRLQRIEDAVDWFNEIVYECINVWITDHCMRTLVDEENGKYDRPPHVTGGLIYGPEMLTEAETAAVVARYLDRLNPVHGVTGLAFYFDGISNEKIANLLQVDEMKIPKRTQFIVKSVESLCVDYARDNKIEIQKIDPHLLLLAYAQLAKDTVVPNPDELYVSIVNSINGQ